MKEKINLDSFVNINYLKKYFDKLYRIPRSILGEGFRKSLNIIGEIADLKIKKVKSGTNVLDWTVPDEWNIKDAYIISPDGKKICEFKKHNLHLVNYSIPVNKTVSLGELKKNIHTIPNLPNAIPYVTSYYNRTWGFCMKHKDYLKLKKGNYKVFIDSKLKKSSIYLWKYLR